MRIFIVTLFSLFLLSGCGYKPSSYYAKKVLLDSVGTKVIVSLQNPQNTVIIRDAIDEAVIMRFRTNLVSYDKATTKLKIELLNYTLSHQQYDKNGYVTLERALVTLRVTRLTNNEKKVYKASGIHDFSIEANAAITDTIRFNAIREGASKAIDGFLAQVSAEGTYK
ncbi:MAG: hypothetical protein GQ570_09335 [Helicobacteraceae bacterium]|nr:hypothetical protein [Helicobacteraceae bacterium]